jgi:hypothetical protein
MPSRSDSPLDSGSVGLSGPKQIGLPLGLGLWSPNANRALPWTRTLHSGVQRQIGLFLGLGLPSPKKIGLFLGLGLWGPRPDRTPKSAPLKSDSGLDSDSVRFLAPHARPGPTLPCVPANSFLGQRRRMWDKVQRRAESKGAATRRRKTTTKSRKKYQGTNAKAKQGRSRRAQQKGCGRRRRRQRKRGES